MKSRTHSPSASHVLHPRLGARGGVAFAIVSALPCPGSEDARPAAPLFREIGARALPGVVTTCGASEKNWILEVNGGGLGLGDFDGDGHVDLVVVDGSTLARVERGEKGLPPRLFLGRGDATFAPAPEAWAMEGGRFGTGCATGDFDGDGWLDLVVTEWGRTRVFHNETGKGWRDLGPKCGFAADEWTTSAAVLDFDRDGKLDLALVNYLEFDPAKIPARGAGGCSWRGTAVMCGPEGLVPTHDRLLRGRGDGTFEDVSVAAGMRPPQAAFGLGAMTLDYDLDGDTDLFVANDSMPNFLWENAGDGTFREVGFARGVGHDANGKELASMGIAAADLNGDDREDLLVTTFSGESNALFVSAKSGGFRERSTQAGIAGPSLSRLGWGTSLADFDLDGDLDATVVNGHVYPEADKRGTDTSYAQPAELYRGDAQGHFSVEALSDAAPFVGRASAAADLDGDGDLDLVALAVEGPVRVFLNSTPHDERHHWLVVRLRGQSGNTSGVGARIVAEWEGGHRSAEMRTAGGFQAAVPAEVHFGLGSVGKLTRLKVYWPGAAEQVLTDVAVDRVLTLERPR